MKSMLSRSLVALSTALLFGFLIAGSLPGQQQPNAAPVNSPLLKILQAKGILTEAELALVNQAASPAEGEQRLAKLLLAKGLIAPSEYEEIVGAPVVTASSGVPGGAAMIPAVLRMPGNASGVSPNPAGSAPKTPAAEPAAIAAVAPIRVLSVGSPKREGLIPAFKIGDNIRLTPFGFFKTSVAYDTQSPYGNDFPLPGFIGNVNGPDNFSEFHLKSRALRLGTNFEWLDPVPNVVVTSKFEMDFEGNFSRVNNRNISSIRSSAPQIRLGYGRVDYKAGEHTSVFVLAGQDWTPFGSSTLPNLLETTGLGLGFGTLYERSPQIRFGVNHSWRGDRKFSLQPEFAVVLPAFGNLPLNVSDQLGFGERQGADSGRPELQARLVAQFQLDKAPGVAPAQIIVSGVDAQRDVVVLASDVPAAFKAAFPSGARISSKRDGWTGEVQLPTRFATVVAKYYSGSDLRYYFAGQLLGPFNDTTGLTGTATAPSIDGSTTVAFGLRAGVPVIANSLPPRSQGGFVNVGLPLSRWTGAVPTGRNAGWTMYLHYGYDQVLARDVRRLGGGRMKGDMFAPQLQYKLNNWVTFAAEESLYRTRAIPLTATGQFPLFAGRPQREMHDFRSEFGAIFTF